MKKLLLIFTIALLTACSTTTQQDFEMLQSHFKIVYPLDTRNTGNCVTNRYICIDDNGNVFDVKVDYSGMVESKIRLNP